MELFIKRVDTKKYKSKLRTSRYSKINDLFINCDVFDQYKTIVITSHHTIVNIWEVKQKVLRQRQVRFWAKLRALRHDPAFEPVCRRRRQQRRRSSECVWVCAAGRRLRSRRASAGSRRWWRQFDCHQWCEEQLQRQNHIGMWVEFPWLHAAIYGDIIV